MGCNKQLKKGQVLATNGHLLPSLKVKSEPATTPKRKTAWDSSKGHTRTNTLQKKGNLELQIILLFAAGTKLRNQRCARQKTLLVKVQGSDEANVDIRNQYAALSIKHS
jgi:hypothetical protein